MGLVQRVEDGKLIDSSASGLSDSTKKTANNSSLDKQAFYNY